MALTYNEISSITRDKFIPKLIDNIFASNILFQRMRKGKMYETYSGGKKILQPVLYAVTSAAGSYSGTDTLNVSANDQISAAEFYMKQYYANITISRKDELENSGDAQIVDFVKAKVQSAEKTLSQLLGTAIYNAGTDADELIGLRLAIDSAGTYGGISRTDYSWWSAQEDSTTTVLTIPAMQALYGDATVGNDVPTLIVTTQDIYDDYSGLLQPQERYVDTKTADGGFVNLMFKNTPVVVDGQAPASNMFMINENYLKLYAHEKENFRFESFVKPIDQNVQSAKIYWAGALCLSNPRMQAKFSALA